MPYETVTFWIDPEKLDLLRRGDLTRWGGVLRRARGKGRGGSIDLHLKEVASRVTDRLPLVSDVPPPHVPGGEMVRLLQLSQVAAAASVLNLGVSIAGFALMNHKLNLLQRDIGHLTARVDNLTELLDRRFDQLEERFVSLRYLQQCTLEHLDVLDARVRSIDRRMLSRLAAELSVQMDALLRGVPLEQPRQVVSRVRQTLEPELGSPPLDVRLWPEALMAFRIWTAAVMIESTVLRQAAATTVARTRTMDAAKTSRAVVRMWSERLFPQELGGVFAIGHSALVDAIDPERWRRLVRAELGEDVLREQERERSAAGAERLSRAMPRLEDRWRERAIEGAGILDFLEEATERIEARAWELEELEARRLAFDEWEGRHHDAVGPTIVLMDMERA